jgi:hypothetical protein
MAEKETQLKLTLKAGGSCAVFEDPYYKGLKVIQAYLPFSEASKLERGNANVRPPAEKHPFKAMEETLQTKPQDFHILNRGIFYICQDAKYDGKDAITIWPKKKRGQRWGIGDGGHTFDVICREVKRRAALVAELKGAPEPFVKVEFMYWDDTVDLDPAVAVRARNTSLQVQTHSMIYYQGGFDPIIKALKDGGLDPNLVAFRENEAKPWNVKPIIQTTACFLLDEWENKFPTSMYTSQNRAISLYMNPDKRPKFEDLFPVLVDIITLPDRIASLISKGDIVNPRRLETLPKKESAIAKPRRAFTKPGTKFETRHKIDYAALLPAATAFRELLRKKKSGEVEWAVPLSKAVPACLPGIFETLCEQGKRAPVPSALGYDTAYWAGCQNVVIKYLSKQA